MQITWLSILKDFFSLNFQLCFFYPRFFYLFNYKINYIRDQGLYPGPWQWQHRVLTTGPPGNSQHNCFFRQSRGTGFSKQPCTINGREYQGNEYQIYTRSPAAFLYANNELAETELENAMPFKIAQKRGFPGGSVLKNPPANAEDPGSGPGQGRSHMPWSNYTQEPQVLKPEDPRAHVLQQENPRQWEVCTARLESSPLALQIEVSLCSNKGPAPPKINKWF